MNYSDTKVTYSDPKVTHSDPTHLPLPPPASPDLNLAINLVKLHVRVGDGGWRVATNFNVSSWQRFKLYGLSGAFRGLLMTIPCLSLPDPLPELKK